MSPALPWSQIETVLLDMDGTLLDLKFDSEFWLQQVPQALAAARAIPLEQARALIRAEYHAVRHTMNWYCFDYWSDRLQLDIYAMTTAHGPTARLREDTLPFLQALRQSGRRTILLTNAHPYSLAVKVEHTELDEYLDGMISTHHYGVPKEDQRLWQQVQQDVQFDPAQTLFVDDAEVILDAARQFGIGYCLGVENPDSAADVIRFARHPGIRDYRTLLPGILGQNA